MQNSIANLHIFYQITMIVNLINIIVECTNILSNIPINMQKKISIWFSKYTVFSIFVPVSLKAS